MNDVVLNDVQIVQRCRNIAVHADRALDLDIVEHVLHEGLDDLLACCDELRQVSS